MEREGVNPSRPMLARMARIEFVPRGPFSLAAAMEFAGGFPAGIGWSQWVIIR